MPLRADGRYYQRGAKRIAWAKVIGFFAQVAGRDVFPHP